MKESKLVLGTVQFGLNYGVANTAGKPPEAEVCRILETAAEHGIRVLDTASGYGDSEAVLGRTLKLTGLDKTMRIVSKVVFPDETPDEEAGMIIRESLMRSLENLQVDHLHALIFHREALWKFQHHLQTLCQEGYLSYTGCSIDGTAPEQPLPAVIQIPSNILDRRFVSYAEQVHGNGGFVFVRSVYLQGLLVMDEAKIPAHLQSVIPCRRKLQTLAENNRMTLQEMCMRYLMSFPQFDAILTGVDNAEQLKENIALASQPPLPDEVMQEIFRIVPELPESLIRPSTWNRK